ncbi:MAG: hypothetical protein H8E27_01665 [Verrucomicrobia subdivision 3 bacterium]|nr:hypothetical protein [Limisphaerales bacterium]
MEVTTLKPRKPADKRTKTLGVCLTPTELKALARAAKADHRTLSCYVRARLFSSKVLNH